MRKETATDSNRENSREAIHLTGLNDNLEFMGKQLHVQTENVRFPAAHVVTQVFFRGKVILSKKSDYPVEVHEIGDIDKMQELMHTQHSQVIKDIAEKQARLSHPH